MNLTMVTPPSSEPVALSEAKLSAKVDITEDDALISGLITASRMYCEMYTKRCFMATTYDLTMERFPYSYPLAYFLPQTLERVPNQFWGRIELPIPPVSSITSITYVDTNGNTQTLSSGLYQTQLGGELQGIITPAPGLTFPATRYQLNAVTVRFVAGYADAPSVPECAKTAIKLLVGHLYRNREATTGSPDTMMNELPFGVKAILDPLVWGSYR